MAPCPHIVPLKYIEYGFGYIRSPFYLLKGYYTHKRNYRCSLRQGALQHGGAVFKRWEFVVAREGRRLCRASGFAGCGEMGGNILGILVQRVPKILSSKSPLPVAWCFKHWKKPTSRKLAK